MLWESEIQDMRRELAKYLDVPESEIIHAPALTEYFGVEAAEFDTPEGVFVVINGGSGYEALGNWLHHELAENGITEFSDDFADWIVANATDEYRMREECSDWCWEDANELARESCAGYPNELVRMCVDADLISGFDVIDGEYYGEIDSDGMDELIEKFADYEFANALDYGSYANWYCSFFGIDTFSDWITSCPEILDVDAILDELERRQGFKPLATHDGIVHNFDYYYAFKIDDLD